MNERFKELKEKAKITKTLDELFDIWSNAHQIDSNSERNMPNGINKDNFVKDGIIEEGSDVDVLFILKEANINNYRNESHSQIGFYSEWIKSGKGLNNPKQQLKMGLMAYYLLNAEAQDKKIDNNNLTGNDSLAFTFIQSFRPTFSYLSGTMTESDSIRIVRSCEKDTLLIGDKATEQAFRSLGGKYSIINLSTHGFFGATEIPQGITETAEVKLHQNSGQRSIRR